MQRTEEPEKTSLNKRVRANIPDKLNEKAFRFNYNYNCIPNLSCNKANNTSLVQNKQLNDVYIHLSSLKANTNSGLSTNSFNDPVSSSQMLATAKSALMDDVDSMTSVSALEKSLAVYSINSTFAGVPFMDSTHLYTPKEAQSLIAAQISLLNELFVVMDNIDVDNDISITINKITVIEGEVPALNLMTDQQSIIYIATNVAKSSISYWNTEGPLWEQLAGSTLVIQSAGITMQNIIRANSFWGSVWAGLKQTARGDVAGAVGGAVVAALSNVVPGAGQIAYGFSIISASAGGSAYEGVMYILTKAASKPNLIKI